MTSQEEKADRFLALHAGPDILLMPNAWDAGSARLLESLGFQAVATTSSGFAATLAQLDGSITRDEAIAHCAAMVAAVDIPVSADLENCFADDPIGVVETIALARETGLAGCSIEDFSRQADATYEMGLAVDRVRAAADAAHETSPRLVLTARADGHLHGHHDVDETIARVQAFQEAGADVIFAPGLNAADTGRLIESVDLPVNVIATRAAPSLAELRDMGARRLSVGGGFAYAGLGALVEAARGLLEEGSFSYFDRADMGRRAAVEAFRPPG